LVFKYNFISQLGLFLSILVLASACAVGEIGDIVGVPGPGPGYDDIPGPGYDDINDGIGETPSDIVPDGPTACPGASPDVSASDGWVSSEASLSAFDALYFEFKARPTTANLDGLLAVGAEDINNFAKAAIAVRFAEDGLVDVRDGSVYSSDVSYAYDPGAWYTVAVSADITTETYDVEIGRCGEPRETLIKGASFRPDANVSDQLRTWAVWSSQAAPLELSTPTWMTSGGCAPATCQSLGQECGQPSNGCGGSLDCGGCGSGEMCSSGVCIDAPVSVPPPEGGAPKPNSSNTGVVNGGALVPWPYGSKTITAPGVYENFTSTDMIYVEADNVTLRNCRITGGYYNVQVDGGARNLVVEDCELTGGNNCVLDYGDGSTFRRVWCHDQQSDAMKFAGSNTVLEYSLLEKIGMNGTTGHHDLVQVTRCSNCEIRFSNLRGETCKSPPYHQSVAVMIEQLPNEFVIRDSWLEGGSAPGIINGSTAAATRLSNNKFGTYYNSAVFTGGSFINDGGNVFECNNSPVNTGNPARPACAVPFPGSSCQ
jgi:hypothetical protein